MTQVSQHFTLAELTHTDTGLPNQPDTEAMANLGITAAHMEKVRDLLGHPIIINSAYRGPEVNQAVRGVKTSAHCLGHAVDFTCPGFGNPTEVAFEIANSKIKFDQLIREYGWVHISFDPRCRAQCLTKKSAAAPYEHGIVA
jgi:hypothetical protein